MKNSRLMKRFHFQEICKYMCWWSNVIHCDYFSSMWEWCIFYSNFMVLFVLYGSWQLQVIVCFQWMEKSNENILLNICFCVVCPQEKENSHRFETTWPFSLKSLATTLTSTQTCLNPVCSACLTEQCRPVCVQGHRPHRYCSRSGNRDRSWHKAAVWDH